MGKIIFRKIGGRLVPIRIGSQKMLSDYYSTNKMRLVTARLKNGNYIGDMQLGIPKKGVSADVISVDVKKEFRGHGISRALFKHSQELLGKTGKKFMRSHDIQHPAQIKIRMSAGKSKFIVDQVGPYKEQSKMIRGRHAIPILKNNYDGRLITGTTMIPKKLRKRR